ncbi:hypothetical protein [Bacillus toyonensis]|uniref:hypothetical protein n=1 Tax=Bacillus toyonensis TaxID=155322 RepID=UPI002E203E68|nr:hypothetical protein [Bacillus toyonensis]
MDCWIELEKNIKKRIENEVKVMIIGMPNERHRRRGFTNLSEFLTGNGVKSKDFPYQTIIDLLNDYFEQLGIQMENCYVVKKTNLEKQYNLLVNEYLMELQINSIGRGVNVYLEFLDDILIRDQRIERAEKNGLYKLSDVETLEIIFGKRETFNKIDECIKTTLKQYAKKFKKELIQKSTKLNLKMRKQVNQIIIEEWNNIKVDQK